MQDRFKFRIALHQDKYEEYGLEKFKNQRIFEVKTLNIGVENSTVEIIAEYPNGDWAVREIDEADVDLIQCTGLKDKNGTLIFEGDIVKTTEYHPYREKIAVIQYHTCFFSADFTEIDKFYDAGFSLTKDTTDFIDIEVIGNIYTNPELIGGEQC